MNLSKVKSQNHFAIQPAVTRGRSKLNRSFKHKTAIDCDYLYPVFRDQMYPGDTIEIDCNAIGRLTSALTRPIMDNLVLKFEFFSIANRYIWPNFERFIGARDEPDDDTEILTPSIEFEAGISIGSIWDYLGAPTGIEDTVIDNNMYARAYNCVWNEWYRAEKFMDKIPYWSTVESIEYQDGPDLEVDYPLRKRCKKFDMFTALLPEPQSGDEIGIFTDSTYPVIGNGTAIGFTTDPNTSSDSNPALSFVLQSDVENNYLETNLDSYGLPTGTLDTTPTRVSAGAQQDAVGLTNRADSSGMITDMSDTSVMFLSDLRWAAAVQQLLEADNRGGQRYVELILQTFGVRSPDYRQHRPEYLGGSDVFVNYDNITASAYSTSGEQSTGRIKTNAQFNGGCSIFKSFDEHCMVLGLVSLVGDVNYQQGMPHDFTNKTRFDWIWPQFVEVGDEPVYRRELYYQADPSETTGDMYVLGYGERYSWAKYYPNQITGRMRSTASASLESYHIAERFTEPPVIDEEFLFSNTQEGLNRVLTLTPSATVPTLILDVAFRYMHTRQLPVYSIPGMRNL